MLSRRGPWRNQEAPFCWERRRLARTEREARKQMIVFGLFIQRKDIRAFGAVRTGRPRSQHQVERSDKVD
jgi:hypothetical protein